MRSRLSLSSPSFLWIPGCLALASFLAIPARGALPQEFDQAISTIQAVGPEGKGNAAAAKAWKNLAEADADAIIPLLNAMETSGPLAANWLRSAVEVIIERELAAGADLPEAELGTFLLDTRQSPQARRLAFDMISRIDAETASKLIPGFLSDPATELRRDAVQRLMGQGETLLNEDKREAATLIYRQALNAARDIDQVQKIADQLTEKLDQELDLPTHFGFLMRWKVIAPFENTQRAGFAESFPPEMGVDLEAGYPGKDGKEIQWEDYASSDSYGKIDLNQPFGPLKEVTGYAYTEYEAAQSGPAELRLGCKNAWKIWFNGELIFGRDEYHRGQRIDQYKLPIQLKEGKNTVLVKLCQNEQTEDWTVEWEFKLRICDASGTPLLASNRLPTPQPKAPQNRGDRKDRAEQ